MLARVHRWSKRLLIPIAAMPICQVAGTCNGTADSFASQLTTATFSLFIGAVQQVLLQSFPSADVLQILLGANRQPFFMG